MSRQVHLLGLVCNIFFSCRVVEGAPTGYCCRRRCCRLCTPPSFNCFLPKDFFTPFSFGTQTVRIISIDSRTSETCKIAQRVVSDRHDSGDTLSLRSAATHHCRHAGLVYRPKASLGGFFAHKGFRQPRLQLAVHEPVILSELVESC